MSAMANGTGRSRRWLTARVPPLVGPAAAAVSTAVLLVTVAGSVPNYQVSPFERSVPAWLIALGLLGGVAIVGAAWFASTERPSAAVGLAVASVGLLVPAWAGWTTLPGPAQVGALAIAPIAVAGASHVGLRWSRVVRSSAPLLVIYALAGAAVIVFAVGYNPLTDPGCTRTCANVQTAAATLLSSHTAYAIATALTGTSSVLAAVILVRESARRRSGVVAWAALLAVIVLPASGIAHAASWTESASPVVAVLPGVIAALLIGSAPLVAAITTRRMRRDVRELVDHQSDTGFPGRDGRGRIRGVQFAVPGDGRWVDWSGLVVGPTAAPARTVVVSDGTGQALRLEVAAGDDPGEIVASLTPATMLALQNARLAAVRRARLADVRASQRRIVDASDAERQRIERDLHDGAQQRLVGALLHLSLAHGRLVDDREALARVQVIVGEALARLRNLGHGIFPVTLATEGLAVALEDMARASDVPTTLDVPEIDLDRDVAMAAYAVVATVLTHARQAAGSPSVDVMALVQDGSLELRVRLIGSPRLGQTDLVDVADRVGAVGGRLTVEPIDGGVAITTVMPCALS